MDNYTKVFDELDISFVKKVFVKKFLNETQNLSIYEFQQGKLVSIDTSYVIESKKRDYSTVGMCEGVMDYDGEFDDILEYLSSKVDNYAPSIKIVEVYLPIQVVVQNYTAMDVIFQNRLNSMSLEFQQLLESLGYEFLYSKPEDCRFNRLYTGFQEEGTFQLKTDSLDIKLFVSFDIEVKPTKIYFDETLTTIGIEEYNLTSEKDSCFKQLDTYSEVVGYDSIIVLGQEKYSSVVKTFEELEVLLEENITEFTTNLVDS